MYNAGPPSAAGGALAYTGSNSLWLALAAFAFIAAGMALWRIAPRKSADN